MISKPFKFRYVNEIAGAFVVTVVLLLIGLVLISGQLQGWFERKRICEVVLPETFGLRSGSEVRILGSRAGSVLSVKFRHKEPGGAVRLRDAHPEDLELVATMEIRGEHTIFIGKESIVQVRSGLVGLGATYVEISPGRTPDPDLRILPLAPLSSSMQQDMTDVVEEIRDSLLPAIQQIHATTREIELLAKALNDPEQDFLVAVGGVRELVDEVNRGKSAAGVFLRDEVSGEDLREALAGARKVSDSLTGILKGLEDGEGVAGALLTDEAAREEFENTLANLAKAVESANASLALVAEASAALPDTARDTAAAIRKYTNVARSLEETVREYEIVGEALQRHWLLRRFVRRDENPLAVPRGAESAPARDVPVSRTPAPRPETQSKPSKETDAERRERTGLRSLFGGNKADREAPAKPAPPEETSGRRGDAASGLGLKRSP